MNRFLKLFSLLIVLVLLAMVPAAQASIGYAIQQSLYNLSTVGVVDDTWQMMQKPELFYKLKDAGVLGMTPEKWGANAIVGGVNLGLLPIGQTIFITKYQAAWTNNTLNKTLDQLTQNVSGNDTNNSPNYSKSSSLYNFGLGQNLNINDLHIGILYDIQVQNNITKANLLGQNLQKTNTTQILDNKNTATINNTDTSKIQHLLEVGVNTGGLWAYIQARIIPHNGDSSSANLLQTTTQTFNKVVGNNVLATNNISTKNGVSASGSIVDGASLLANIDNIRNTEIDLCPEVKLELNKVIAAYFGGEYDTRSLTSADARYENIAENQILYTSGAHQGAMSSDNTTDQLYGFTQNGYSMVQLYSKLKIKQPVADDVKLYAYPALTYNYKKVDYSLLHTTTTINKSDLLGDGTFNDAGDITTSVASGDNHQVVDKTSTVQISFPVAFDWAVTKVLSFRFGTKITLQYLNDDVTTTDNSGMTSTTTTVSGSAPVTTPSSATTTTKETVSKGWTVLEDYVVFGIGLNITDHMTVDLLSTTAGSEKLANFQFQTLAVQTTYMF